MEQKRKKKSSFQAADGTSEPTKPLQNKPRTSFFLNLLLKTSFLKKKKTSVTGIAKPKPCTTRVVAPNKDATNEKKVDFFPADGKSEPAGTSPKPPKNLFFPETNP
jgi:hypothetical protein